MIFEKIWYFGSIFESQEPASKTPRDIAWQPPFSTTMQNVKFFRAPDTANVGLGAVLHGELIPPTHIMRFLTHWLTLEEKKMAGDGGPYVKYTKS